MIIDVRNCARCGEGHEQVPFEPFGRPPAGFTAFATCPRTMEPILMTVEITPDEASVWTS